MKIACIVLASGKSTRFGKSRSKLIYKVYGLPIIEYTLKNISKYINKKSIYITISKKLTKKDNKLISKYSTNQLIYGGKSRVESLKKAFFVVEKTKYDYVVIHDAARPNTTDKIFKSLLRHLKTNKYDCVIPSSKVEDTLRRKNKTIDRSKYLTFQTPQVFKFKIFRDNLKKLKHMPTDDLGVIEKQKNLKIKYIEGNKENLKITKPDDLIVFKKLITKKILIGNGFDIHKLSKGNFLALAGLKIKSELKSVGHSDGDVVLHSIIDALLGATSKGDIGKYFPSSKQYKNADSKLLLEEIKKRIKFHRYIIENIDCTVICQRIRLENYKDKIGKNIAKILNCKNSSVNIKAKTADNIGIIGKSRAIACWTTLKIIKI